MASKTLKAGKKKTKNTPASKKPKAVKDGTVKTGEDQLGREVRHFVDGGKHYVEANRNGATHPVECKNEAAATKLYKQELAAVD